jgi:hypothetical protein
VHIFANFKLSTVIITIAALPIVVLLGFSGFYLNHLGTQIDQAKLSTDLIKLSVIVDGVAHFHAVERGVSAGFLASGGKSGADALKTVRADADKAEQALRELTIADFKVLPNSIFNRIKAPLLTTLAGKARVRSGVDSLDVSVGPFAYYSTVNRLSLEKIARLTTIIQDQTTSSLMDDRIQLLWMKERAGQVRGGLNGVFKVDAVTPEMKTAISQYLSDEISKQSYFMEFSSPAHQAKLSAFEKLAH